MRKTIIILVLSVLLTGLLFAQGSKETSMANYPDKTVEFVVPAGAGGGSDILARLILDIIQKNKLVDGNIVVVNKGGGAGSVGHQYMSTREGNYVIATMNAAHAMALRANPYLNFEDFAPIANVAMDNVLFVTGKQGAMKSLQSVIDAAKASPEKYTVGCADNLDMLSVEMINEAFGIKLQSVYYDSANEIVAAILGGHVDFGILNPNECYGQIKSQDLVGVASFATERMNAPFETIPTFTELGYPEVEFQMFRSIIGGVNMSNDVQQFWSDVFKKVTDTEQWQKEYIEKNMLEPTYMPSNAYAPYHFELTEQLYQDAKKIGLME